MKIRLDEKNRNIARTAVWVFTICLAIGIAAWRWSSLIEIIKKILSVMAPILLGLVFAYLLNPMQSWFEKKLLVLTGKKKQRPRLCRGLSVTLATVIMLAVLIGLVAAIVPELVSSIKNLINNMPEYMTNVTNWMNEHIDSLKDDHPDLYKKLIDLWNNAQNSLTNFITQFEPKLDSIAAGSADFITTITSGAFSFVKGVGNFLFGVFFAIYLLLKKEYYLAQARKLLYAMLPEKGVHSFLRIFSHFSETFMNFLSGKTLDSFIIGLLCFIGMTVLQMPYITLISIIIGVTNIIPVFGPFIGAIPCGLLILLSQPGKTIPFVIFILVLQQFDGNFLGPKILGNSLGLPMFWILSAIVVGGGMFGFIGMVAFVPLFAAMYALFTDFLNERLKKKGLPADTSNYMTNEAIFAHKDGEAAEAPPEEKEPFFVSTEYDPNDPPVPVEALAEQIEFPEELADDAPETAEERNKLLDYIRRKLDK